MISFCVNDHNAKMDSCVTWLLMTANNLIIMLICLYSVCDYKLFKNKANAPLSLTLIKWCIKQKYVLR